MYELEPESPTPGRVGAARPYRMSARARSAEVTGERILDAMLARFAVAPFDAITLDEIANEAGVTVQTVIRRFGGKAGVLRAVVARELGRIAAAREGTMRDSAAQTLAALVDHYEHYGLLILKFYAEAPLVEGLPELAVQGRGFHVDWCRRVFDARIATDDPVLHRVRSAQVVAICDATTWRILRFDGGLDPAETERALGELLAPLLT
ncbi:hypothetical protein GCM10009851_09560 [Herbiconiux moechotypicola]|uniref:HTH tetR-type domain-containing protein n=2 Tax=Herbiconiux moechotypicola TaxID=637393 RepID=A0ABP5Q739_9MICO